LGNIKFYGGPPPPEGVPPEGHMTWTSHYYAFSADISKILYDRANIYTIKINYFKYFKCFFLIFSQIQKIAWAGRGGEGSGIEKVKTKVHDCFFSVSCFRLFLKV
jgi:hypothetical protein